MFPGRRRHWNACLPPVSARCDEPNLICVIGKKEDAIRINRLLVEKGHEVFDLSTEDESLEEIFLSLTRGTIQ